MEYITIYNNKKMRRSITNATMPSLRGLIGFFNDMWFWQPEQMEQDIQKGERRWQANSSSVDLLEDGNFQLSRENYTDEGKYEFVDFFTVSRPALYDFMEQWKKIDHNGFEKIIISYDGSRFKIETFEKMTPEEEHDPMWIERFK